jgi:hypothetical protein
MQTDSAESITAARKTRWQRFYDLSGDTRFMLIVNDSEMLPKRPLPNPDLIPERIEWAWSVYQQRMAALEWLDDDRVPFLDPYTGTEIFAEAFGCPVHYTADKMPFALPLVHSAAEAARLRVPDLAATRLAVLFEIADELRRRAGGPAVMRLPDIQTPLDIVALIWDKHTFYPALLEDPDPVLELAEKVRELQTAFLDAWFARYGTEFIAHYPDYYMPSGLTLSEDEVGAVSPRIFEQYFLPELQYLARRYGSLGMHCCAHARHQWKGFLRIPNLKLINFVQPQAVLHEACTFFAGQACQMHNWSPLPDLAAGPANFPAPQHHVLQPAAATREQAQALTREFRALWQAK